MAVGHYISGIGHGVLIAWVLFGGLLPRPSEDNLQVADVSIISGEEYAALTAPKPSPEAQDNIPTPEQPQVEDKPPEPSAPEAPPEVQKPPEAETPPPADQAPEVVDRPAEP
ncbi:MAG TPA: hypothetical protein ENJ91_08175, partial [Rhodobacteraceae bacterium]|nr:hypothetical protein [Paracoccaceae bacterium]